MSVMHTHTKRSFQDHEAKREQVPLRIALVGPSGSGKTFSAFRLAVGIQKIDPGPIFLINTEGKRGTQYAEYFSYREVELTAPFNPLSYRDAIDHCVERGAKTIIIDSVTHEHAGAGGVLDMHEAELTRIAGKDWKKRARVSQLAWQKPKAERDRLRDAIDLLGVNLILCFRAKEKIKPARKKAKPEGQQQQGDDEGIVAMGWMAVGADDLVYAMDLSLLLPPGGEGVPIFRPDRPGEQIMFKLPIQFRDIFAEPKQLSEGHGEAMARWAAGGAKPRHQVPAWERKKSNRELLFERAREKRALSEAEWLEWLGKLNQAQQDALADIAEELAAIKRELDPSLGPPPDDDDDLPDDDDTFPGDRPSTLL
jgi:ABC-type oligopeptide transport system ATPase subunit